MDNENTNTAATAAEPVVQQQEPTPAPAAPASEAEPAPTEKAQETPADGTQETKEQPPVAAPKGAVAAVAGADGKPKYVLVEDELTHKRRLKLAPSAPKEGAEAPAKEPDELPSDGEGVTKGLQDIADGLKDKAQPYSLDEFSTALAVGNVDEERVPPEYMGQYANYKIQRAIDNQKRQAETEAQQKAQLEKQLSPEEQKAKMQEFLHALDEEAGKRAAFDAGLTDDDISNLAYMDENDEKLVSYKLFKEWRRNELMREMERRAAAESDARQRQAAIYRDIGAFIEEARKSEPNFDAIDKMMSARYQELPYGEGRKVEAVLSALKDGSITEAQTVELRKYYEDVRKEFYARRAGLSTKPKAAAVRPPQVERPGTGKEISHEYVPDYKALRNAGPKERRAWLAQFLSNKGR